MPALWVMLWRQHYSKNYADMIYLTVSVEPAQYVKFALRSRPGIPYIILHKDWWDQSLFTGGGRGPEVSFLVGRGGKKSFGFQGK